MKRERRHELQHNDLAEWIVKNYERISPYRNAILGVGLLAVVLLVGLSFWRSHSAAQAGEAWNSLGLPVIYQPNFAAEQTISVMENNARTNAGLPAGEWAQVFAGDSALVIGTNRILTEKKVGTEYLTQARDLYAKALTTLTIPSAREQAMFGKARALESLIRDKDQVNEAVAAYQELNKSFPHGMFKAVAEQRIEELQKKESLRFYEALAQYTPKPKAQSPRSQLGNLGNLPENPTDEMPVPTTPVRPDGSRSGPAPGIPEPSLTPTEPAKSQSPKTGTPKTGTPKSGPAKTDSPKTEPAKPQATESDASKPEAAKKESPKAEAPKTEAPKTEPAKPQATEPDASKPEAAKKESPKAEAPKSEEPRPDSAKKDK